MMDEAQSSGMEQLENDSHVTVMTGVRQRCVVASPICSRNRLGHEECINLFRCGSGVDKWQPFM